MSYVIQPGPNQTLLHPGANEYSPTEDPINDIDLVKNPLDVYGDRNIRNGVVDEPPTQCLVDAAIHGSSPVQSLPEHVLFAVFDYVRDAHAFVKCESVCRAFCSLLQSPDGIGRKLWEARPILYGNRGILNDIGDGGRRFVLEDVAFKRYEVPLIARRKLDSVVLKFVEPALWSLIVEDLHARCRPDTSHLPSLELSDVFVKALTEITESWVQRLIKGALMCSVHRGSSTITAADIELARALSRKTKPCRRECLRQNLKARGSRTFSAPDGLTLRRLGLCDSLPTRCPGSPLRRRIASSACSCDVTVVSLITGEPTSCCGF